MACTTYRLGSSPLMHTPGIVAWAINGYAFEKDQAQMINAITVSFPSVPVAAITALLSKAIPYSVEGDTVVFSVPAIPSSRTSTHHFDNEAEAIAYRETHGTGGWIFVCNDKGEATIFPHHMTPSDILKSGMTSQSGGRFIGASGRLTKSEDVA